MDYVKSIQSLTPSQILCQPPHDGGGAGVSAGPHGGIHHQHGVPGGRDDRGLLQREEEDGEPVV